MQLNRRHALGGAIASLSLLVPLCVLLPTASAAVTGGVVVNEVESSGGTPGDWIELANPGPSTVDLSGYVVRDNDDTHTYVIPASTSVAPAGYYVVEEAALGFGLGSADAARLFAPDGTTLLDSYSWTAHASTTYGRCPDSTGAFATTAASTKGTANSCATTPPTTTPPTTTPPTTTAAAWPGSPDIRTVDPANVLGGNMSGLAYEASGTSAPGVLWAVKNGPSTLYRLLWDGTQWTPDTANGWGAGKALHYPDGTGDPDTEGVTLVGGSSAAGVYVSTERNNSANTVSRPEVLRLDVSGTTPSISASAEWNLTADLPAVGPNLGLEAIVWFPDSALVAQGFKDEKTGTTYDPATYANHGSGLFLTGLEANGQIYAYALDQSTGAYTRVATVASGFPAVMDLHLEAETGDLWAVCDDTCSGRTSTLRISTSGATAGTFQVTTTYERPSGMPNINNEGFTITPQAECVNNLKPVFWADDSNTDGHALRGGSIRCTTTVPPTTTTSVPPTTTTTVPPTTTTTVPPTTTTSVPPTTTTTVPPTTTTSVPPTTTTTVPPTTTAPPTSTPPVAPTLYKLGYADTLFQVSGGRVVPISYAQWQGFGFPAPVALGSVYEKYAFSTTLYAESSVPGVSGTVLVALTPAQWSVAGFPVPSTTGFIGGSFVYQFATGGPELFLQLPITGETHALTFAEWSATGFLAQEVFDNNGFFKLAWDPTIAYANSISGGDFSVISYGQWAQESFPSPDAVQRFEGDVFTQGCGTPVIHYTGPTLDADLSYSQWVAAGSPAPTRPASCTP